MTFSDRLFILILFGLSVACWFTPMPVLFQSAACFIAGILYADEVKTKVRHEIETRRN